MNKEWIFWAILVAVIATGALYFKFYSTQTISMFVSINGSATVGTIYPFEKILLPITVQNTGSGSITNLVFDVKNNGNSSVAYQLSIPEGKSVTLQYNFTPSKPGAYNISVVADPAQVYNIVNRQNSMNTTMVVVTNASPAMAYSLIPQGNLSDYSQNNYGRGGFIASSFLFGSYKLDAFAPVGNRDTFITSLLNITQLYIRNVSVASASYANGASSYSVWIRGYLSPSVMGVAASGRGYKVSNYTINGTVVTVANMTNTTTLCSWYQGGWIKSVVFDNASGTCLGIYKGTIRTLNKSPAYGNATYFARVNPLNSTLLGNFSGRFGGKRFYSTLLQNGVTFVAPQISINSSEDSRCLGVISKQNGTSFCSVFVVPANGFITGIALIRTTAYVGNYNLSVYTLVNNSRVFQSIPTAFSIINKFNISGTSASFSSGFSNTCQFNSSFPCGNANFYNGTLVLRITNNLNQSLHLNSLSCYSMGTPVPTKLSQSLPALGSMNLSASCYSLGKPLGGIPLNLQLSLLLNYTAANVTKTLAGNATINIFSS
ncbi:MAG: hypothetical protein KGH54_00655 [Candidatus Micrarchaeota archaeon]|nr:hypothetical protein [Candidatus Micrarchaeota archaeon]